MTEQEFEKMRSSFRRVMAEKSLAEIRATKRTFEKLNYMYEYQRRYLIDDLSLLENYKEKSHSANEEFEKIVEGYYRAF